MSIFLGVIVTFNYRFQIGEKVFREQYEHKRVRLARTDAHQLSIELWNDEICVGSVCWNQEKIRYY